MHFGHTRTLFTFEPICVRINWPISRLIGTANASRHLSQTAF